MLFRSTKTYTITQPTAISITNSITNLNYYGSNDGSISLNVSGGTSPYVYAWTKTGDGTYSATTQNIGSLVAATYNVRVTDGNACVTNVTSLTVTQPSVLSIVKTLTPVNCYGEKVGAITIVVSGGTAGYTYLWNDGATTQNRTGIGGGTYSVTITDSKNGSKLFDNIINSNAIKWLMYDLIYFLALIINNVGNSLFTNLLIKSSLFIDDNSIC